MRDLLVVQFNKPTFKIAAAQSVAHESGAMHREFIMSNNEEPKALLLDLGPIRFYAADTLP
jgi:hypothetical protein